MPRHTFRASRVLSENSPASRHRRVGLGALAALLLVVVGWTAVAAAPQEGAPQDLTAHVRPGESSRWRQTIRRFDPGLGGESRAKGLRLTPRGQTAQEVEFAQTGLSETFGYLQQASAALVGGGFGVVWEVGSYPSRDVRMQWLDRDARPVFAPGGRLVAGTPADEIRAVITAHPSAGAYVAFWKGGDVVAQYFDGGGVPQWPGDGVLVAIKPPDATLNEPHIIANPDGGVFVCFRFSGAGPTGDIRCQHIDASGTRRWSDSGASVGSGGDREWRVVPRGLADGAGGLMVFWRNQRDTSLPSPGPMLMEGQRFSGNGQKLWGATPKVVRTTGLAASDGHGYAEFQVASDGSGGAVLAFNDWAGADPALDVMAQRVSAAGDLLWGGGAIVTSASGHQQHEQTIAAADGGAFVAVYEDVSSTHSRLRLFRLGPDGGHLWSSEGLLLSDPSATALDYGVFGAFDNGLLRLAWTHQNTPSTFTMDVAFVTYSPEGQRTGDTWLTQANDAQFLRGLVYSSESGGTLGLWDDRRKGTSSDMDVMGGFLSDVVFRDGFEGAGWN